MIAVVVFLICVVLLAAGLLAYSQTLAFAWDEGFHLLAAQSIAGGKQPYLDFIFAQTPLNAYWNAGWMHVFGNSWRGAHVLAALLTVAAVALAADFLRTRFRIAGWGLPCVLAALILAGANEAIVQFGTVAQAYGMGLFLTVAAFRAAVLAVERGSMLLAGLAGLLAAGAAGSTLLTAPVAPVLLIWMLYYMRRASRISALALFAAGAAVALSPLLVLLAKSPSQVFFDVFKYHMFYRRSGWPDATEHDVGVYLSWIDFPQALILSILAVAGLWFVAKKSGWDRGRRGEFYLCGWLALALGVYVSTAHPTFERYYLFTVPFLSILSAVGLYSAAVQMGARRALWPVLGVLGLTLLGLGKSLYDGRDDTQWANLERLTAAVEKVTPAGAPLYADEHVYFLSRRTPPLGNEYLSSHQLDLPPALAQAQRIVPQAEFDRRIAAGEFATVETCEGDEWVDRHNLAMLYKQKEELGECDVFWDLAHPQGPATAGPKAGY